MNRHGSAEETLAIVCVSARPPEEAKKFKCLQDAGACPYGNCAKLAPSSSSAGLRTSTSGAAPMDADDSPESLR